MLPIRLIAQRQWSAIKESAERWSRAIAYARGRMSADQAQRLLYDCQYPAGYFPLVVLDVDGTLNAARERWQDDPALETLVRNACDRVCTKHQGNSDVRSAAEDWALDLVSDYAEARGIQLEPIDPDDDWVTQAEADSEAHIEP